MSIGIGNAMSLQTYLEKRVTAPAFISAGQRFTHHFPLCLCVSVVELIKTTETQRHKVLNRGSTVINFKIDV